MKKIIQSRTIWTLVIAFAFNGFQAISGNFDPQVVVVVNGLFALLTGFFKMSPSQDY